MDFISQWWPAILLLLSLFDKEAALVTAALFASTAITGPAEVALVLFTCTLLVNGFYFLQGLSIKKRFSSCEMPKLILTDRIEAWLDRFGLPVTAFMSQIVFKRKSAILALICQSNHSGKTFLWMTVTSFVWITVSVLCLTIIGQILIEEFSTLTKVRFILPGLTVLAIVCSTIFRIAVLRSIYHYHGTNNK